MRQGFRSTTSGPPPQAQEAFGAFMNANGTGLAMANGLAGLQLPRIAHHQRQVLAGGPFTSKSLPSTAASALPARHPEQSTYGSGGSTNWAQDFAEFPYAAPGMVNKDTRTFSTAQQHYPHGPISLAHNLAVFPSGPPVFESVGGSAAFAVHGATSSYAMAAESDFDSEMDKWMATHGEAQVENVDAIMEKLALELEQQSVIEEPQKAVPLTHNGGISIQNTSPGYKHDSNQSTSNSTIHGHEETLDGRIYSADPNQATLVSSDAVLVGVDDEAATASAGQHANQRPSEISEAARQILESVQHEQGDKWRNSRFLLLMRDFRDGNKDIVENEILETCANGDLAGERAATARN